MVRLWRKSSAGRKKYQWLWYFCNLQILQLQGNRSDIFVCFFLMSFPNDPITGGIVLVIVMIRSSCFYQEFHAFPYSLKCSQTCFFFPVRCAAKSNRNHACSILSFLNYASSLYLHFPVRRNAEMIADCNVIILPNYLTSCLLFSLIPCAGECKWNAY